MKLKVRPITLSTIPLIFILFFSLACMTPALMRQQNKVFFVLGTAWALFYYVKEGFSNQISLYIFIAMVWAGLYKLFGVSATALGNVLMVYLYFYIFLMGLYFYDHADVWWKQLLVRVNLIWAYINFIDFYIVYKKFPLVDYYMNSIVPEGDYARTLNFPGSSHVYPFIYLIVILVMMARHERTGYKKIGWLLLTIAPFYYIALMQRMTGVMFLLAALFALIFIVMKKRVSEEQRKELILGTLLFILIFSAFFLVPVFYYLGETISAGRLADRFTALAHYLEGDTKYGEMTSEVIGRTSLVVMDLKSWLSSPISFAFGIGRDDQPYIGGHQPFFDALASYGVVGLVFLSNLYWRYYQKYIRPLYSPYVFLCFFLYMLLTFFNGVTECMEASCIFIFVPSSVYLIKEYAAGMYPKSNFSERRRGFKYAGTAMAAQIRG